MAKDIRAVPELVEARRLALAHNVLPITHSFVSDLETPVSAFLKLGAPRRAFLLESAEQGQHMGRFSFLGVGARALVTGDIAEPSTAARLGAVRLIDNVPAGAPTTIAIDAEVATPA